MSHLTERPLDLDRLVAQVVSPKRGAVATFTGVVRNHHEGRSVIRLEYSAYESMAESECDRIVADAERQWPVRVVVEHRTGRLDVGDASVMIAAAGTHRREAFDACRWVIEEVKRRVPIWKREYFEDGTVSWVDPTARAKAADSASTEQGSA